VRSGRELLNFARFYGLACHGLVIKALCAYKTMKQSV
jgi:hypothetical protein